MLHLVLLHLVMVVMANLPNNYRRYDVVGGIERFNEEMCALEQVLPQWQEEASNDKVAGWMFQGFHKTGLYANWPMIYQCRTENQCTGCSDPRFVLSSS